MREDQKDVLLSLLSALKRAQDKFQALIVNPELLDQEEGEDALDVICMQFLAAGESLKRLERPVSWLPAESLAPYQLERSHGFSRCHRSSIL